MIKIQLLPFLPFIAFLMVFFCNKFSRFENFGDKISALLAILFLITSFKLKNLQKSVSLIFLELPALFNSRFDFGFDFDANQMPLLLLLGIFWLLACLHHNRYFVVNENYQKGKFHSFLLLIIGFLSAIILSQNLLTILLFYQLLAGAIYFTAHYFSPSRAIKSVKYFGFFILATSSLLFLATALTLKISGQINFTQGGVFANPIDIWQFSLLLFFYILAIASIAFVPVYLFFGNLYYLSPPVIVAILLGFAFASLVLLFKVISYIFGTKLFAIFMPQINHYHLLTIAISLNLLASAIMAVISKNLKQIVTWLFFNQMIAVIMAFLVVGLSIKKMQIVIASFVLGQLLIFIAIGNINLYLKASEGKILNGIFYKLRITISALIFALLNLSGLIPSIGMVEKYWLFRELINDKSLVSGLVLLANIGLVFFCGLRMVYPMLEISSKNNSQQNYEIAKKIELDLSLILPTLLLPLILLLMMGF